MELQVAELIGAECGERRPEDRAHAPQRLPVQALGWGTRAGELELQIPELRRGSCFPVVS